MDTNSTCEDFQAIGTKPNLAPTRKYRVKVLDEDLPVRAVDADTQVVRDDQENTHDASFG